MKSKKAQELSLRTIILFIIAFVVLITILVIFSKYSGNIFSKFSEIVKGIIEFKPTK